MVLATPVLVREYGVEGFGLIGLWISLQVVIGLFDMGMSSVLGRELARNEEDADSQQDKSRLLVTFETLAWAIATGFLLLTVLVGACGGFNWIESLSLAPEIVERCLTLILVALAVQFPSILYTGGMAGLHQHRVLNCIQVSVNTMRWGGGAVLAILGFPLTSFFVFQIGVSFLQCTVLRNRVWYPLNRSLTHRFSVHLLRRHLPFAVAMAGTSICAALISNIDRLFISNMLTTADLGKYAISFMACSIVQMIVLPFYRVFYPRYSSAVFSGDVEGLRSTYLDSARWLSSLVVPMVVCVWAFPSEALSVWLGSDHPDSASIMRYLLVGVGMAALGWLPGALQQAHGYTSLHLGMLVLALLVGVPCAFWAIQSFGMVGATAVWLVHGLLSAAVEPWLMHRKYLRAELFNWYAAALFVPLATSAVVVIPARLLFPDDPGRWQSLLYLLAIGALALLLSFLAQSHFKVIGDRHR